MMTPISSNRSKDPMEAIAKRHESLAVMTHGVITLLAMAIAFATANAAQYVVHVW